MAQQNRKALREQESIADMHDTADRPVNNNAIEIAETTLPGNRPPERILDPVVETFKALQRQYKARYGYKPVGLTAEQIETEITRYDRSHPCR
jgi:hypothetical protein